MARFADNHAVEPLLQRREKSSRDVGVEGVLWRQLHQHRTEFAPQRARLTMETVEQGVDAGQLRVMRDRARRLDGEAECIRDTGGPARIRGALVRPVE
jgi:hypothetical protein